MCRPEGYIYIFFQPFWSENGSTFCPFWSGIGYRFRGNYGIYYFGSKMNTEKGRVIYKFEVGRVTIWRTRWHTPKGAHTTCVCNRLLFYSKCIGFTICLIYSDKLIYTTQCEINVELPNLWYTVVLLPQKRFFEWFWVCRSPAGSFYYKPNSKRQAKNPSNSLKKPLLRQKDDNILQDSYFSTDLYRYRSSKW